MDGVAARPGFAEQLTLIAGLRWNLFRNSLRTMKGRLEVVSLVLVGAMMGMGALGAGVGLGVGSYFLAATGRLKFFGLVFWGVFLFWQLFPLLAAASSAQFDFANLLRYPLRFSTFYTLSLVYGFFDAPALIGMLWLGCIVLGLSLSKPALLLWALPVAAVFALVNVLLNRAIFAWLDRWLKQRRTREALVVVFILSMMSFQLIGPVMQRWGKSVQRLPSRIGMVVQIASALPPGLAGESLVSAAGGAPMRSAASVVLLAAYGGVFAWLLSLRLRAQYLGENLGETVAPAVVPVKGAAAVAGRRPWQLPFVSAQASAVFEKEARYLLRSGPMLIQLVLPIILMAPLAMSFHQGGRHGNAFNRLPTDLILPVAAAYALLVQAGFIFNSFGFDGNGVQFLFMAPLRFREVLIGKNLMHGCLAVLDTALVGVAVSLFFTPPGVTVILVTMALMLFALLGNFSAGNLLSLAFPRRMEFGMMRQRRVSGVTIAASLGMQVVMFGICASVLAACVLFHRLWLAGAIYLVMAAAIWPLYQWSLNRGSALAIEKREVLIAELCRQE